MRKSKPIPEFTTLEEASEFWDTHSSADFEDQWKPVEFTVNLKERRNVVVLDDTVARAVRKAARREGLAVDELVNRWLRERLAQV